jgi:hypothetical protein
VIIHKERERLGWKKD